MDNLRRAAAGGRKGHQAGDPGARGRGGEKDGSGGKVEERPSQQGKKARASYGGLAKRRGRGRGKVGNQGKTPPFARAKRRKGTAVAKVRRVNGKPGANPWLMEGKEWSVK